MKTRKQKGGLILLDIMKGIILGIASVYGDSSPIILALSTFFQAIIQDQYNYSDDAFCILYLAYFYYHVKNSGNTEPTYIQPLTINLKLVMKEPSIKEDATKMYSTALLFGIDCLFLQEGNKSILTILLDLLDLGLTKMTDETFFGNTTSRNSATSVESKALAAWALIVGRYMDIVQEYEDPNTIFFVVLGNLHNFLFTPEMPSMVRNTFIQTNWHYTKRLWVYDNLTSAIKSLRQIKILLPRIGVPRLHRFLRDILKKDFIQLPDIGPATDISFILWLFLKHTLASPLNCETFMDRLTFHSIDKDDFVKLLAEMKNLHSHLYVTEISILNSVFRTSLIALHPTARKVMDFINHLAGIRRRGQEQGGGGLSHEQETILRQDDTTLGHYVRMLLSKIVDSFSAKIDTDSTLQLKVLSSIIHNKPLPKETPQIMDKFNNAVVKIETNDVSAAAETAKDELKDAFVDEDGDVFYDPSGGKRKTRIQKRKTRIRNRRGGDFGITALTATIISVYGVAGGSYSAFYNVLNTFISESKSSKDNVKIASSFLYALLTTTYNLYNNKSLQLLFRGNTLSGTLVFITDPNIDEDLMNLYRYSLLLSVDALFLYDGKPPDTVTAVVIHDDTYFVAGQPFFNNTNNLFCPLLDIWMYLLEHVPNHLGPTTDTSTAYSVESRVARVWKQALARYTTHLTIMNYDKNYTLVFDALHLFLFKPEIPEFINRMLLKSMFYYENGLINYTLKDSKGKVVTRFTIANYNQNIKYLKNILTLLKCNTTVRLDRLYIVLRKLLQQEGVIEMPFIDGAVSFNYVSWVLLQNILNQPAQLINLLQTMDGGLDKDELTLLYNDLSGLYYGLYMTSWTDYTLNSAYQGVQKLARAVVKAAASVPAAARGAANSAAKLPGMLSRTSFASLPTMMVRYGGLNEEFLDPENAEPSESTLAENAEPSESNEPLENVDEMRNSIIKESFGRIMSTINFIQLLHVKYEGKTVSSDISEYQDICRDLVSDFSKRVELGEEPIDTITNDIVKQLYSIKITK